MKSEFFYFFSPKITMNANVILIFLQEFNKQEVN